MPIHLTTVARSTTRMIALFAAVLVTSTGAAASPRARVSFMRTVAPPHDLGKVERIAVIYAIGDNDKIRTFVDVFLDHANRSGTFRVDDATEHGQHLFGGKPDESTIRHIRREHPADIYIGVNRFSCDMTLRGAEGSTRDVDGERVRRRQVWVDAVCRTRVDVIDGITAKRLFSFDVTGEGTSPRSADITDEERNIALLQAARYVAINASEEITPRRVRESIELDDTAPAFEEAVPLIDAERFGDARGLWESALRSHPSSAALHYNLGAVCEAMGDLSTAREHFQEALRLSPDEARYRAEIDLFRKRNATMTSIRRQ